MPTEEEVIVDISPVESSNQLGTILTIKHLEVQLQDLPTYYGLNQDTNIVGHGSLAGDLDMCLCA